MSKKTRRVNSAILTLGMLCFSLFSMAQEVVKLDQFLRQVANTHPMMQQSELRAAMGEANLRLERAVMDPTLSAGYGDKGYDGKDYYEKRYMKLSLPTSVGVEIFTGFNENSGPLINPEVGTGNAGQYEAGVTLPIGGNLIFNERQQAIRQAKLMNEMAMQERRIIQNDLMYRASLAYLNWSLAQSVLNVQEDALEISQEQFEFAKRTFEGGDRPAIDTVESFLQVQTRSFMLLQAQNDVNTARLVLSTFLWDDEGLPAQLPSDYRADSLSAVTDWFGPVPDSIILWKQELSSTHPELQIKQLKIKALDIERQTQISNSFPQLEVKYAVLSPGYSSQDIQNLGFEDRMLGVGLKYPLLARKGRAKTSQVNIKSLESQLDLDIKQLELNTKLDALAYDYQINEDQAVLYDEMVNNFQRLLSAERTKFTLGESSVFLLNSRENKLFEAQVKQLQTQAKLNVTALKIINTSNQEDYYFNRLN